MNKYHSNGEGQKDENIDLLEFDEVWPIKQEPQVFVENFDPSSQNEDALCLGDLSTSNGTLPLLANKKLTTENWGHNDSEIGSNYNGNSIQPAPDENGLSEDTKDLSGNVFAFSSNKIPTYKFSEDMCRSIFDPEELKYKCGLCSFKTDQKSNCDRHVKSVHMEIKLFWCHLCDFKCLKAKELRDHTKSLHTTVKEHKCSQCNYKTKRKSYLSQHVKLVHVAIRKHHCTYCEYKCKTKSDLDRHVDDVHLKAKHYLCHLCNHKASRKWTLEKHINTVHEKILEIHCDKCKFKTSKKTNLTRHVNAVHLQLRNYLCQKCDYRSNEKIGLRRHIEKHHPDI